MYADLMVLLCTVTRLWVWLQTDVGDLLASCKQTAKLAELCWVVCWARTVLVCSAVKGAVQTLI